MKEKAKKPTGRAKSYGTIALVEGRNGQLDVHCNLNEAEGTDTNVLARIREAIAGLAYIYEREFEVIDKVGKAYLSGMEEGIHFSAQMNAPSKEKKGSGAKMGFRADIK